jgi:hypothetical protein
MRANKVRVGLVFVAVVLIFSTLTLLYWDFVRETIIIPIYYLLWVADLTLKSIPQGVYLALLIFICILIGWNTLINVRFQPISRHFVGSRPQTDARYTHWKRLYSNLHSSSFGRETFVWEARKLVLSILAHQYGIEVTDVEARVRDGRLPLPNSIEELIRLKTIPNAEAAVNAAENPIVRLRRLFFRGAKSQNDPQIDHFVNEMVLFIEHQLEINHAGNPSEF